MKKIAYILTDSRLGGTERFLLKIVKRLLLTGEYDIAVFTLIGDGTLNSILSRMNIRNKNLRFTKLNSLKNFFKLKEAVSDFKPDFIHSFLFHANYFSAHLKKQLKYPKLIVSERCLDLNKNVLKIKLTKYYSRIADLVTAVSEEVMELLMTRESIPKEKIILLKNGIDQEDYLFTGKSTFRSEFNLSENSFLIINIARFRKEKGHHNLIYSFKEFLKEYPDSYLILTGEGEAEGSIKKLVLNNNLSSRVIFTGTRNDVMNLLKGSDLAVNSSLEEGFSAFNLEAILSETPLILTDTGGNKELIKAGLGLGTGSSPEEIKDVMARFMKNRDSYSRSLSEKRKIMLESFSFKKIMKRLEEIYE